jgi:hypothetical protein
VKHIALAAMLAPTAICGLSGCGAASSSAPAPAFAAVSGTPPPGPAAANPTPPGTATGTVVEAMESGGYTYVRLETAADEVWFAATDLAAQPGDRLTVGLDMPMEHFHSRTLNRDFPLIYFVSRVARGGEALAPAGATPGRPGGGMAMEPSHRPGVSPAAGPTPNPVAAVAPPPGGVAIAEVWARRVALSGKVVVIRGRVVKANHGIMGRNWFHLQDGSGKADDGTNDVTVTSDDVVRVGDIVTVSGTLVTGKDFGAGYVYDAIVENATVMK